MFCFMSAVTTTVPPCTLELTDIRVYLCAYVFVCVCVQVPWADLRYLFGEIMYGGHIVNDFDRWDAKNSSTTSACGVLSFPTPK